MVRNSKYQKVLSIEIINQIKMPHPYPPPGVPVTQPPSQLPSHSKALSLPQHPGLSLVPLSLEHAPSLYLNLSNGSQNNEVWTYIPVGPFTNFTDFKALIEGLIPSTTSSSDGSHEMAYAIISSSPVHISNQSDKQDQSQSQGSTADGTAIGIIRLLNIRPAHLSCEVGMVLFPLTLQRTIESTLVFYLLVAHAFDDLGHERVEWKCNALNAPSSRAAERLGFQYEGLFRKHFAYKGVWRDTWWGSILGDEWRGVGGDGKKGVKEVLESWLATDNFDENGKQKRRLESFRE